VRGEATRVLVVDDEADIRELLDLTLARMGLQTACAGSLAEARALLAGQRFQLCLTDMRLPDGLGLELVRHIAETSPILPVAVITAHGSAENAVSALKAGAFDYIAKPVSLDQLRGIVKSALDLPGGSRGRAQRVEPACLGESPAIAQVRGLIDRVARSQAPVHIAGESGSGKELAARLIHNLGAKARQALRCGELRRDSENLMESEFFGYRKGAFTGANDDRTASSRPPTAARCSSTRWPNCPCRCR
jgi:two-component system response regulator PilR (NtrC family)